MNREWLTERLLARAPLPEDLPAYEELLLDPAIRQWLRPPPNPPFEDADVFGMLGEDRHHWDEHGFGPWVLADREGGAFVGRGGLRYTTVEDDPVVEVTWAIKPAFWGVGLATEAALAAIEWARSLQLREIVAMTLPHNSASRRVAEKAGFRFDREIEHAQLPHVLYRLNVSEATPTAARAGGG